MIFKMIEQKLAGTGLVVSGETLFWNYMGPETNIGVLLRSPLTGIAVDPFIEGRHSTEIQIIVRHTDPVLGQELLESVSKVLTVENLETFEIDGVQGSISMFYPKTLPVQFPRLQGNGIEFSQHFHVVFAHKPTWR